MQSVKRVSWVSVLFLALLLVVAWLLWSGMFKPLLLGLGVFSCVISLWVAKRIGFFEESYALGVIPGLLRYWLWLLWEIVKTSVDVARIILHPKLPISPTIVEFKALPKGPVGQVILANSITLTPGTVTLDVYEDTLRVHCLTKAGAEQLLLGEFNSRAAKLTRD
ncbi:MAG: Na+/H+ antiporter subunit E [Xanthomonadales bacterium]|nr:Na+/H+ antiporter subunit E [Xanthomonadales bacterium]